MLAASDDAASSGGRRPKTSKGGNRDLGCSEIACVVVGRRSNHLSAIQFCPQAV